MLLPNFNKDSRIINFLKKEELNYNIENIPKDNKFHYSFAFYNKKTNTLSIKWDLKNKRQLRDYKHKKYLSKIIHVCINNRSKEHFEHLFYKRYISEILNLRDKKNE